MVTKTAVLLGLGGLAGRADEPATAEGAAPSPKDEVVVLDGVTVFSNRVALQEPTSTVAAPVSALRFEPQVDVQARNFAEGQADVTIRGGTFENTGFSVGALPLYDPQTGHYSAEIPVSPQMLGAPEVRVGSAQAATGFNATAGGVAYGWRPVRTGGAVSVGAGGDDLARGEAHAGAAGKLGDTGYTVGADVAVAASQGDGTRPGGDHDFNRYNGRVQIAKGGAQTDFFAGYQSKNFAWPNLYAARNQATPLRDERERLQTKLFVINHRATLGADGDYVQAGAYYRGNRDDYRIPAFAFRAQHETVVRGAALDGRQTVAEATALRYAAGVVDDDLDSSNLTFGRFMSRTQGYGMLAGEHTLSLGETRDLVLTAGARYDESNRDGSEVSPLARAEWREETGALRSVYLSYDESTQVPTYQALNAAPGGLFGGDPDLGRATTANLELGALAELASWTVQAAVFARQDDAQLDYIFDPTNPASSRRATTVDLDTVGAEIFARRNWERLELMFGYTYLHKDDDYTAANTASFYALNYAEHRFTAGVVARLGGGFELRMDNELRRQEENALRQGGRDNVDTALGLYYFVPGVEGLVLNAQVENLWDTDYQDVPLVPSSGRAWSVGASYVW